jgi:hypothetical protein
MLPCLSCKQEVPPADGKVFAEVFMCPSCFRIAERLLKSGDAELKMMLLVLKESIRVAALTQGLQYAEQYLGDMPKEDLVSHLAKMAAEVKRQAIPQGDKQCRQILTPTRSLEPMLPSAPPVAGKPDTSSTSGQG